MGDYVCYNCNHDFDPPADATERMTAKCPKCASPRFGLIPREAPAVKPPPDSGWEYENKGRGRYISQLQKKPGPEGSDKNAFCRTQSEAMEKAKRMGFKVERTR